MPWWIEQIVIGTAAWAAVTAALTGALLSWRHKRAVKDDEIVDRALARGLSLYEAAEFTDDSGTEVAVWLLLEDRFVHIARDGKIRPTISSLTGTRTPEDDRVQAAVLDYLRRNPHGSKLHEIKSDRTCRDLCEPRLAVGSPVQELRTLRTNRPRGWAMAAAYLIPIGAAIGAVVHATGTEADFRSLSVTYWTLGSIAAFFLLPIAASKVFRRRTESPAQARLRRHCERMIGMRFARLGFEEERRSARVFRTAAPAYAPRRRSSTSSSDASCGGFVVDSGGSSGSSCSSSSSCGSSSSSCGGSSSSCGGGST